jgi:hypothetical protein
MLGVGREDDAICKSAVLADSSVALVSGPLVRLCRRPSVLINLPSYTSISDRDWEPFVDNVLAFVEAFNRSHAAAGVSIVSFSPLQEGSLTPDMLTRLAGKVKARAGMGLPADGPQFRLGITRYGSLAEALAPIKDLNKRLRQQGLPTYQLFGFDSEDPDFDFKTGGGPGTVEDRRARLLASLASQAPGAGVDTVCVPGGPSMTAQKFRDVYKLGGPSQSPVATMVAMPEIYDLAYGGCKFPPPLCEWSVDGSTTRDCAKPKVDSAYIAQGVEQLFTSRQCTTNVGVKPDTAFLTTNTRALQTWPAFSIQQPDSCFGTPAGTITGGSQTGCNNLSTFTLAQFVEFLLVFAERTALGRLQTQPRASLAPWAPVPVMLYEAAYIPLAWMQSLGLVPAAATAT